MSSVETDHSLSSSDIQTSGPICSLVDCFPSLISPVSNIRIIAAVYIVSYTLQSIIFPTNIGIIDVGIASHKLLFASRILNRGSD